MYIDGVLTVTGTAHAIHSKGMAQIWRLRADARCCPRSFRAQVVEDMRTWLAGARSQEAPMGWQHQQVSRPSVTVGASSATNLLSDID